MTYFRNTTLLAVSLGLLLPLFGIAQNELPSSSTPYRATPAHMWEFGLHGGPAFVLGDIDFTLNWGTGFHFRRAIDYVFSIRGEGLYSVLKYDDPEEGIAESTFKSGSVQLLVSINNLVWNDQANRKTNVYGFVGGGVNQFQVDVKQSSGPYLKAQEATFQTHADFGLGIAFRVADRFNLGFETKGLVLFGNQADLLDGVSRRSNDVLVYPSARLNFNLGNKEKRAEPLYWVNPMDVIMRDITELKNRPLFDPTDTDGDGVIDLLDADNTTPPGVAVDTRGIALDSDGDGVPDNLDKEPYAPSGEKIVRQGPGGKPNVTDGVNGGQQQPGGRPYTTEDDVERIVDNRLKEYADSGSLPGGSGITDWFLPIIHFGIDSYKIRYADYGNLSGIAKVMKANADIRVVVTGFTDKTASDTYNLDLSFKRAKSAIEHLVNVHGIARSRLILNYNGEDYPLVPAVGSSMMNRRVEFRVATGKDNDMENPVPVSKRDRKNGY